MSLFVTELRRFWGRRITRGVIVIALLLSALAAILTFVFTDSPSADAEQAATEGAARETQICIEQITADVDAGRFPDPELIEARDQLSEEQFAEFLSANYCYYDPTYYSRENVFWTTQLLAIDSVDDWSEDRPSGESPPYFVGDTEIREVNRGLQGIIPTIAVFFLVLSVVVGASFMGAEYKFGTVENLLLWEPRRAKVLGTKFAAGFLSSVVLTFFALTTTMTLLYLVTVLKGSSTGVDGRFWVDMFSIIGRSSIAGGLFFVIAMSVAVLARNTTASVGLILGWFVISNIIISIALKFFRQWELFTNATAFISEGDAARYTTVRNASYQVFGHGYLTGVLVVAVWALVFAAAATFVFVRRDVD